METQAPRGSRKKLLTGARLAILSPAFNIPCHVCESFIWKPDGDVQRLANGQPMERTNPDVPTRCQVCPKVPLEVRKSGADWKACRAAAIEPSEETLAAIARYREFRAVGSFPDDAIVRWYASIIRQVEDARDRRDRDEQNAILANLVTLISMRRRL